MSCVPNFEEYEIGREGEEEVRFFVFCFSFSFSKENNMIYEAERFLIQRESWGKVLKEVNLQICPHFVSTHFSS
jgi:hypothetical protein